MSIWFKPFTAEDIRSVHRNTLAGHLEIEITDISDNSLTGCMPVNTRTVQPYGILHGGAAVALAETVGSVGAAMTVDTALFQVVGQEINANHLRPVREGQVQATARPIHIGKRSQVWGVEVRNDQGQLTCIARLTMAVIERRI